MASEQGTSRSWSVLGFGARRQWKLTVGTLAVVTAAALGTCWPPFLRLWTIFDPVVTLGTLGAALLVWFGEARQDWERSLVQQLTAEFWFRDRGPAYRCERAPLLDQDPRAWAQQIGRQMNGGDLSFWPVPQAEPVKLEYWKGQWVRHLVVRFELREWPEHLDPDAVPLIWSPENEFGRKQPAATPSS